MNTPLTAVIETNNLKKVFPGKGKTAPVEAVSGVSFAVGQGEIFGLLGPNGAGKTTMMRMLSTLLTPTAGDARVVGFDLTREASEIRKHIGYVSQVGGMQRELTGRENLRFQARLYGMETPAAEQRVAELIDKLGAASFADRKTITYSGGQRRLFDLACGIVHQPKLLFLDEPSTGLDPQNRSHVWEQVKKLHATGTSVFLTTHYLDEADALCHRVAIVDRGTIVAIGTPNELKKQIAGDIVALEFEDETTAQNAAATLRNISFIREAKSVDRGIHLYVDYGSENLPQIMRILSEKNIAPKSIQLSRPSLDDVFLKLTGRSLQESA